MRQPPFERLDPGCDRRCLRRVSAGQAKPTGAASAAHQQDKSCPHPTTSSVRAGALGGRESGRETNWHISLGELLGVKTIEAKSSRA